MMNLRADSLWAGFGLAPGKVFKESTGALDTTRRDGKITRSRERPATTRRRD
jgi:hypothetical protein